MQRLFVLTAATLVAVGSWLVITRLSWLPVWFYPGLGVTEAKNNVEYFTIVVNLISAALVLRSNRGKDYINTTFLVFALMFFNLSALYFTNYIGLDRVTQLLGHIYKVIGYFLIYRSIVVENLELPYRRLARAQAELEVAVSASNTGLWSHEVGGDEFAMSPVLKAQLGYEPHELQDQHSAWLALVHPDDVQEIKTLLNSTDAGNEEFEREFRMRAKSGEYRWILLRGRAGVDRRSGARRLIGSQIDVSVRHREESRFRSAVEASPTAMVMVDQHGIIVLANSKADRMFGYEAGRLLGQSIDALVPPERAGGHKRLRERYIAHPVDRSMGEERLIEAVHADGHRFHVEIGLTTVASNEGRLVLASITDISARLDAQQRIEKLTNYDALTGIPNRGMFCRLATTHIASALGEGRNGAVLLLNLDNFKYVNETLGHDTGDALLKAVSSRVVAAVGSEGACARIGGDDFALMLMVNDEDNLIDAVARIRSAVSGQYVLGQNDLVITASIGVATFPADAIDIELLLQKANIALDRAKADGRNRFRIFADEMHEGLARLLKIDSGLHEALSKQQMRLVYQPQFAADGKRIVGAEALLRWNHPELGAVPPSEFIPLAERNGQIIDIGDWVLVQAVQQLKLWQDANIAPTTLAVNLSAAQLAQADLAERLAALLAEYGVSPALLELELTETAAMTDPEKAIMMAERFHAMGVKLSIDDFGTGYSSLNLLKRFKIHRLKIDKSFIDEVCINAEDRTIVTTVIHLAHDLGFLTVAEGVESADQFEFLRANNCDQYQGYLFSRPLEAEAMTAMLEDDARACV